MATFSGQGAVVTGASGGVGAAVARALAADGAAVLLVGRDPERLEAATAAAGGAGGVALAHRADLTVDEDVRELVERCQADLPGVDVLVHAAAIIEMDPLASASLDDLDRQYRTNVRAPYALTQALLDPLRQGGGQVVFVNSTAGRSATAGSSQYAATKHALTAVADGLRAEVNSEGIRVLTLFLGSTATPMQESLYARAGRAYRPEDLIQPEDVAHVVVSALSTPGTAEVTEIAMRPMKKP
jgi:NADP-dependent 3-hydroxy acid dehydrogenase YdfG